MVEEKKEGSLLGNIIAYIAIAAILLYIGFIIYMFITNLFTVGLFDALGMVAVFAIPLIALILIAIWVSD